MNLRTSLAVSNSESVPSPHLVDRGAKPTLTKDGLGSRPVDHTNPPAGRLRTGALGQFRTFIEQQQDLRCRWRQARAGARVPIEPPKTDSRIASCGGDRARSTYSRVPHRPLQTCRTTFQLHGCSRRKIHRVHRQFLAAQIAIKFLNWSSVRVSVSARVLCMPIAGHANHQPRNSVLSASS